MDRVDGQEHSAFGAERFFALWDRLERDVEMAGEAGLAPLRAASDEPAACRPIAPDWGLAAAVFVGGGACWSGPSWRDLFGETPLDPPPATLRPPAGSTAYVILRDRREQPVLVAFARWPAARAWPIAATALRDAAPWLDERAVVAMAFAPSRLEGFADFAARAYGLRAAERELLEEIVAAAGLAGAAARLQVSEAAIRKRVRGLLRRTGSPRRGALLARMTRLVADESVCDWARNVGLRRALGLPGAEMRLSHALAEGQALPEAAAALRLSPHTVRDQARSLLARTGMTRLADLPRFLSEARALVAFAEADETARSDREGLMGATRIFQAGGRQVAAADFGPPDGEPVMFLHGGMGSRRVARRLCDALRRRGLRPIGVDRPGFGLTDPVPPGALQFEAAARDMALVLDAMGLGRVRLVARDGGAPAALAFAALYPHRVVAGLLISPRPPRAIPPGLKLIDTWVRLGSSHPSAIVATYALLRRKAGVQLTEILMSRLFGGHPADAALIADPIWRHAAVAELLTCGARTADGLNAEQTAYPAWTPPMLTGPAPWTVVTGGADPLWGRTPQDDPWRRLPGLRHVRFETGGRFIQDTHADQIAALT